MTFAFRCGTIAALVSATSLAGCAGGSTLVPLQPSAPAANAFSFVNARLPNAGPPPCKGQKNTKQYATVGPQGISTKGGSLCLPAFGGWGGSIQYPNVNEGAQAYFTTSTTAYQPGLFPPPGSMTPLFYIQFSFSANVTFGSKLPAGNGIASEKVIPLKAYTAESALAFGSLWEPFGSCYSIAKKVKYGGGIGRVGSMFLGKHMTPSSGVIEIYQGKLVGNKC